MTTSNNSQKIEAARNNPAILVFLFFVCFVCFVFWYLITSGILESEKNYCSNAEKDASMVLVALAEYFSDPETYIIPTVTVLQNTQHLITTNPINNISITPAPGTRLGITPITIQVTVRDASKRCHRGTAFTKAIGGGRGVWK